MLVGHLWSQRAPFSENSLAHVPVIHCLISLLFLHRRLVSAGFDGPQEFFQLASLEQTVAVGRIAMTTNLPGVSPAAKTVL